MHKSYSADIKFTCSFQIFLVTQVVIRISLQFVLPPSPGYLSTYLGHRETPSTNENKNYFPVSLVGVIE